MSTLVKILSTFSAQRTTVDLTENNAIVASMSAQTTVVDKGMGDNAITKAFSAQHTFVEKALGENKIAESYSAAKAGYEVNGVLIPFLHENVNIIRVK